MSTDKIYVTKPFMPELDEYIEELKQVWDNRWITNMGPKHEELKEKLRDYLGVEMIELFTNGHMAIEISLQALGLTEGEVITSPFTFVSTTHAIVRAGLTPVFCDIDPTDYTIDPEQIESHITDRIVAILPIHVYGNICHIEDIQDIADRHGLRVIYDAAHTFGETYKGRGIGSFGDVSIFSFHATKVYNSAEGGGACFHDPALREKLSFIRDFGIIDEERIGYTGPNAKMNELCAALGICNLRHVDDEIARRGAVTERYRGHLQGIKGIRLNPVNKDVKSNHAYFPAVFDPDAFGADRDEVFEALKEAGIGARKYFYPITTAAECYRDRYDATETPVAKRISESVLSLPLYGDLALEDVDRICSIILSCRR